MTPLLIYALVFVGVSAVIGVLFFMFGEGQAKTTERLDMLTGRKKKDDETTTILQKDRHGPRQEIAVVEALTPNVPSLQKLIMQADANITPSTFMVISGHPRRPRLHGELAGGREDLLRAAAGHPLGPGAVRLAACTSGRAG